MALTLLSIHQAAQNLLDCACEALGRIPAEMAGLAGCPCRTGVVAGTPAADACDGGCDMKADEYPGQLTVNVARIYTADRATFPAETRAVRDASPTCELPQVTAVDLVVQVWRCSPIPDDTGCPPSMADLDASAMQMHVDMMAVQSAVLCCFAATDTTRRKGRRYSLGATTTIGPQGGCVGFQTLVTVALDDCIICPTPAPTSPEPEPEAGA